MIDDDSDDPHSNKGRSAKPNPGWIKKGERRNPAGRRLQRDRGPNQVIAAAANERVPVMVNGKRQMMTKFKAAVTQQINAAAGGNERAFKTIHGAMRDAEKSARESTSEKSAGYVCDDDDLKTIAGACARLRAMKSAEETSE